MIFEAWAPVGEGVLWASPHSSNHVRAMNKQMMDGMNGWWLNPSVCFV